MPSPRFLSAAMRIKTVSPTTEEVLVEESFAAKAAILNRPRKLNSLNENMIDRLLELYMKWEKDERVRMVIIAGAGRGFCAGGDVAVVYLLGKSGDKDRGNTFFGKEFRLNYILGTYEKTHVALLDGVVMGGGNGVSMHGKFRIATENTKFAMPETAIGLHPDIGASYFLSRLPGHLGEYLGLTGTRLDGADLLSCGLVTHFVPSKRLDDLVDRLGNLNSGDPDVVSSAIDEFCDVVCPGDKSPLHRDAIDRCFGHDTVEEIVQALEIQAGRSEDEWYTNTLALLKKMSPISLKVALRSIREGRQQSLFQCLESDYRLVVHAVNATHSTDFYEGCRALLVDKDNKPKWSPPTLAEVTKEMVDDIFGPFHRGEKVSELLVQDRERNSRSLSRL
ncbi:3-hydroxyisobutyryl-CoA hydrolase 1 isoform X2 [Physcomitrium patens]|uniref:3-hydroxyisobutyryl-CoA hydrolase 1 isoform X2 n=1 Tax=Physcomitrium patens TaxID=3218 RepID=UPI003CCD621D